MVWRNYSKKIKSNKIQLKLKEKSKLHNIAKNSLNKISNSRTEQIKSGVIHKINDLTGKKVKDAFIEKIFKKLDSGILRIRNTKIKNERTNLEKSLYRRKTTTISQVKKSNKSRLPQKNSQRVENLGRLLPKIKDNSRLSANSGFVNLKNRFTGFKKSLYTPVFNKKKWNLIYSSSVIVDSQNSYLQSNLHRIDKNVAPYEDLNLLLSGNTKGINSAQKNSDFNNFIRQFNYKNLLFRSFWFSKFISTLVTCGKKQKVWKLLLNSMSYLKVEFGRNPTLMLFEILELYRMPVRGLSPKSLTRKVVVRTHLVSWWKQYTQILRWVRHSLLGNNKNHSSWGSRVRLELYNLLFETGNTLMKKRIEANTQLIAFGRVALHFRWHRRYSKRAVRAIKVLDKKFYS